MTLIFIAEPVDTNDTGNIDDDMRGMRVIDFNAN